MNYAWRRIMAVPDNYLMPPPSNTNGNGGRWRIFILELVSIFTRPDIYYYMRQKIFCYYADIAAGEHAPSVVAVPVALSSVRY